MCTIIIAMSRQTGSARKNDQGRHFEFLTACVRMKPMQKKVDSPPTEKSPGIKSKLLNLDLKSLTFILIVLLLLVGAYLKKDWLIVATVNNRPIWRWEYSRQLNQSYGQQVLDQLINQELVEQKIDQSNVEVTQEEIEQKISDIEGQLGGMGLDEALQMQGISRERFQQDLKTQIAAEKIVSEGIEVTEEEINQFITDNAEQLSSEEEEQQVEEATQALQQQKLSEKFNNWYQKIKEEADITRFLSF